MPSTSASARRRPCAVPRSSCSCASRPPWSPSSCPAQRRAARSLRSPRSHAVSRPTEYAAISPHSVTIPGFRFSTSCLLPSLPRATIVQFLDVDAHCHRRHRAVAASPRRVGRAVGSELRIPRDGAASLCRVTRSPPASARRSPLGQSPRSGQPRHLRVAAGQPFAAWAAPVVARGFRRAFPNRESAGCSAANRVNSPPAAAPRFAEPSVSARRSPAAAGPSRSPRRFNLGIPLRPHDYLDATWAWFVRTAPFATTIVSGHAG